MAKDRYASIVSLTSFSKFVWAEATPQVSNKAVAMLAKARMMRGMQFPLWRSVRGLVRVYLLTHAWTTPDMGEHPVEVQNACKVSRAAYCSNFSCVPAWDDKI